MLSSYKVEQYPDRAVIFLAVGIVAYSNSLIGASTTNRFTTVWTLDVIFYARLPSIYEFHYDKVESFYEFCYLIVLAHLSRAKKRLTYELLLPSMQRYFLASSGLSI